MRCEANILFVLGELQKRQPNAEYDHLTLVGHSNGGDVSMYFAHQHPELVSKVITLDNLRVPFVTQRQDEDPVVPLEGSELQDRSGRAADAVTGQADGIDIVNTGALHTELSDRGPDSVKEKIQATLDKFLRDAASSALAPADTTQPMITNPGDY